MQPYKWEVYVGKVHEKNMILELVHI